MVGFSLTHSRVLRWEFPPSPSRVPPAFTGLPRFCNLCGSVPRLEEESERSGGAKATDNAGTLKPHEIHHIVQPELPH